MKVEALQEVRDNGKFYQAGEQFDMADGMVDAHVKAGQVKLAETPQNKQVTETAKK